MLVLSRKPNEAVVLTVGAVKIEVMCVDVRWPDKVRLGFVAPKDVVIVRKELLVDLPRKT